MLGWYRSTLLVIEPGTATREVVAQSLRHSGGLIYVKINNTQNNNNFEKSSTFKTTAALRTYVLKAEVNEYPVSLGVASDHHLIRPNVASLLDRNSCHKCVVLYYAKRAPTIHLSNISYHRGSN